MSTADTLMADNSTVPSGLENYHPFDPLPAMDIFPKLREFRHRCPAFRTTNEKYPPVTFFTRYADVASILRDSKTFRNMGTEVRDEDYDRVPPDKRIHIFLNPPEHTDVRALLLSAISPQTVKRIVPLIEQLGDEVVGRIKAKGRVDIVPAWAAVFPGLVTAYLLGLPREDGPQIHAWVETQLSDEVVKQVEATTGKTAGGAMGEWFDSYIRKHIELRRNGTINVDDGLSRILSYVPRRGYPFTDDELVLHVHSLIVAANESTTGFMSSLVRRILLTPGLFERVQKDRTLVEPVINEVLRFDPPLLLVNRNCRKDVTVGGAELHPGDGIVLSLASANRDEREWGDDAEEFNPDRYVGKPDAEMKTFGLGIHFCPGGHLARLEARIALNSLLDHTRNMRLAPDCRYQKVWYYLLNRPKEVLVEFDPA